MPLPDTNLYIEDGIQRPEFFWRRHYDWFKDQGYQLRPRFAPDWVPSWKGTNTDEEECEDGLMLFNAQVNDAVYIPTGSKVALKRVFETYNPHEAYITQLVSSEPLSRDPRNHSVPLLDTLHPPFLEEDAHEGKCCILVIPWLRRFHTPIFDTFGEALESIRQLFEGVQFLHENRVAHRDIAYTNFMMDTAGMFSGGFHPERVLKKPDLSGKAKYFTRTQRPPKYYLIDFGMSRRWDADDVSTRERMLHIADSLDEEALDAQNPYFKDILDAGNLVRREFILAHPTILHMNGYRGFEFLKPLIDDMVQDEETKRPTMNEVVKRFDDILNGCSQRKLRSRTSYRSSNIFRDTAHMFGHWKRRIVYVIKKTPAIPRRDDPNMYSL